VAVTICKEGVGSNIDVKVQVRGFKVKNFY
jgi:hypothetical protein